MKNIYFKSVICTLGAYHFFYILSFTLYYILQGFIEPVEIVLMAIIYPAFFLFQNGILSNFNLRPFFIDELDLFYRVAYILSLIVYSLLGLLIGWIIKKFKK